MHIKILLLAALCLTINQCSFAKDPDTIFVAFWNLENLFDTIDDPYTDDQEFLPGTEKDWTEERLEKKLNNLARIINSMNEGRGPDLLGVCEVEHEHLLQTLINDYLNDRNYKTVYYESPDGRGIDNGLIYNADLFSLISSEADTIFLSEGENTRSILNVSLLTKTDDTLVVFVNHWPSRRGGEIESEPKRIQAALTLKKSIDQYYSTFSDPRFIILGDFNDEPANHSLLTTLNAHPFICDEIGEGDEQIFAESGLLNISYKLYESGEGSYKYRDDWNMLDQIIISNSLIGESLFNYICGSFEVYKPEIMITKSGKYEGTPFPGYGGSRYLGGYSDHFPVTAKFVLKGSN